MLELSDLKDAIRAELRIEGEVSVKDLTYTSAMKLLLTAHLGDWDAGLLYCPDRPLPLLSQYRLLFAVSPKGTEDIRLVLCLCILRTELQDKRRHNRMRTATRFRPNELLKTLAGIVWTMYLLVTKLAVVVDRLGE